MRVFALVVVHNPEMPTPGNLNSGDSFLHWVNLYEMSTYRSCWSWSVSQFSTCMTLLIHGCQRNSFWKCQTDSQMYTFPDQMNWQFVQILMGSKIPLKVRVLDTDDLKQKTSLFSVQGKSAWYCFKAVVLFFFTYHLCPVQKVNAPTPITAILATHLFHEFIVNIKHRIDWSCRKRYICLSCNFWKQYPSDEICLTSVNMQKYVISLLWGAITAKIQLSLLS